MYGVCVIYVTHEHVLLNVNKVYFHFNTIMVENCYTILLKKEQSEQYYHSIKSAPIVTDKGDKKNKRV